MNPYRQELQTKLFVISFVRMIDATTTPYGVHTTEILRAIDAEHALDELLLRYSEEELREVWVG